MNSRAAGFTLVELTIVTVLGALILGAVFQTLLRQQQSSRQHEVVVGAQQTTRTVLEVLATELREISPRGGDVVAADRHSITLRAFRKVGFVCNVDAPGHRIDVWELATPFAAGDSLLVFADDVETTMADDTWELVTVSSVANVSCAADWFGDAGEGGVAVPANRRVNVPGGDAAKLAGVRVGAPVRSFEPVTYGLFEIDGEWVLGQQRRTTDSAPEPLVGPVAPPGRDGLVFRYFDDDGVELSSLPLGEADRQRIARLEIVVRAVSPMPSIQHVDSLKTQIFLRNR